MTKVAASKESVEVLVLIWIETVKHSGSVPERIF